jgi:hypothetical protein
LAVATPLTDEFLTLLGTQLVEDVDNLLHLGPDGLLGAVTLAGFA